MASCTEGIKSRALQSIYTHKHSSIVNCRKCFSGFWWHFSNLSKLFIKMHFVNYRLREITTLFKFISKEPLSTMACSCWVDPINVFKSWNFSNVRLCETGCDSHLLYITLTTGYVFCCMLNGLKLSAGICDVTVSCDSHVHNARGIASIVAVLIPIHTI